MILLAILFLCIDFSVLFLLRNYFNHQVHLVQHDSIRLNVSASILCYVFLIFGLYYFIIKPKKSVLDAFLLGIMVYGVYETTNKALLKNWKWETVFIDTLWGGTLFALTTYFFRSLHNYQNILY